MQENGALNPTFIPTLKLRLASRPPALRTPVAVLDAVRPRLPLMPLSTLPAQLCVRIDVPF